MNASRSLGQACDYPLHTVPRKRNEDGAKMVARRVGTKPAEAVHLDDR
jgi:hypothetical protein